MFPPDVSFLEDADECEVVRVTHKRYQALLISDAILWLRGPVQEADPSGPVYLEARGRGARRQDAKGYQQFCYRLPASDPPAGPWHPPLLNSDFPGMTAYGLDSDD